MVLVEGRGVLFAPRDDDVPQRVVERSICEQLEDGQGAVGGRTRVISSGRGVKRGPRKKQVQRNMLRKEKLGGSLQVPKAGTARPRRSLPAGVELKALLKYGELGRNRKTEHSSR